MKFAFTITDEDEVEINSKTASVDFESDNWITAVDTLLALLKVQGYIITNNSLYLNTHIHLMPDFIQNIGDVGHFDED